jgi:hypothetical protein
MTDDDKGTDFAVDTMSISSSRTPSTPLSGSATASAGPDPGPYCEESLI